MMSVAACRRRVGLLFRDFGVIRFSPLDLRVILRLACVILIWKFLSVDYSAFPDLLKGPEFFPMPPWISPLVHLWQHPLFDQVWKVQLLQGISALFLGLTLWRLNRLTLLLGLLPILLVEWNAFLYRNQMYDLDVPAALLLLALLGPWRNMLAGNGKITKEATWAGFALTAYMGGAYFMGGWSKLALDPLWWEHIRLDFLYPTMEVWHGATFPGWLQPIAYALHQMLALSPELAQGLAILVLAVELGWWLALFSRTARYWVPLMMLLSHLFIFLGSGILFLTMAVMAGALIIPWRKLLSPITLSYDPDAPVQPIGLLRRFNAWGLIRFEPTLDTTKDTMNQPVSFMATDANGPYHGLEALLQAGLHCPLLTPIVALAFLPGLACFACRFFERCFHLEDLTNVSAGHRVDEQGELKSRPDAIPWRSSVLFSMLACVLFTLWYPTTYDSVFPFARYNQFGWSYAKTAEPTTVYRLGYRNPQTGAYQPLPNNYGGFLDYRLVSLPHQYIEALVNTQPTSPLHIAQVSQFVRAIRTNLSDRWLLGPLAFPEHIVAHSEDIPADWLQDIYLLEGYYQYDGQALHHNWIVRAKLHRD